MVIFLVFGLNFLYPYSDLRTLCQDSSNLYIDVSFFVTHITIYLFLKNFPTTKKISGSGGIRTHASLRLVPKTSALDRSATLPCNVIDKFDMVPCSLIDLPTSGSITLV